MKSSLALLFALCVLLPSAVAAAHITDKLVVGLYATPGAAGQPQRLLSSGTPLDVLSHAEGFAKVRLADGAEGWVEADYVTEEKPARAMLLETQARLRTVSQELAALKAGGDGSASVTAGPRLPPSAREAELQRALGEAQARIDRLEAQLGAQHDNAGAREQLGVLQGRVREAVELLAETQGLVLQRPRPAPREAWLRRYLPWGIGLGALVLGFASGALLIDYRIRKRYGGVRI